MSEDIERHILRRYEILEKVGRGAYGIVWKAKVKKQSSSLLDEEREDCKPGRVVALKKIFDAFHNATDAQRTFREVIFLTQLNHENIIKLCNVHKADNNRDLYLIFEHMEADLHTVNRSEVLLQEIHKKYIVYQILKCLKYLHSAGLVHRDLKPSNILLNSECHVKVCDFGLARSVHELNNSGEAAIMTDYVATRWYRSPEILLGSNAYTTGVDIWSLGCILGELLGSKAMFPGKSTRDQIERVILTIGYPSKSEILSMKSPYAERILQSIKDRNPSLQQGRITHTLSSMYPRADAEALNCLYKFLQFDPNNRMTALQALKHPMFKDFHHEDSEQVCDSPVTIHIDENKKFSVNDYRTELYAYVEREKRRRREQYHQRNRNQVKLKKSATQVKVGDKHGGSSRKKKGGKYYGRKSGDSSLRSNFSDQSYRRKKKKRHHMVTATTNSMNDNSMISESPDDFSQTALVTYSTGSASKKSHTSTKSKYSRGGYPTQHRRRSSEQPSESAGTNGDDAHNHQHHSHYSRKGNSMSQKKLKSSDLYSTHKGRNKKSRKYESDGSGLEGPTAKKLMHSKSTAYIGGGGQQSGAAINGKAYGSKHRYNSTGKKSKKTGSGQSGSGMASTMNSTALGHSRNRFKKSNSSYLSKSYLSKY